MLPGFDPHVHAAPSTRARWGTDLDLVDAAARHGVRGFVLKSHHESTAARAAIATQYAARTGADCRVVGSVVLNPWLSPTELERALELGARVVWWPTLDERGYAGPFELPELHELALELLEQRGDVVVGTGHLALPAALALVQDAVERGLRAVATHPLNPDLGVGVAGGHALAEAGALVEVDARSLQLSRDAGIDPAPLVRELLDGAPAVFASSDGGQLENGDPFAFLAAELAALDLSCAERLCAGSDVWLSVCAGA